MRELLAVAVRVLVSVALATVAGGVVRLFLCEHAPAGPAARELIAYERDRDARYYPEPVLLSDRGRRLRRGGLRLVGAAAGARTVALVLYLLAAHA